MLRVQLRMHREMDRYHACPDRPIQTSPAVANSTALGTQSFPPYPVRCPMRTRAPSAGCMQVLAVFRLPAWWDRHANAMSPVMVPATEEGRRFSGTRTFPAWTIEGSQSAALRSATRPVQSRVNAVRGHSGLRNETTRLTTAMTVRPASSSLGFHRVSTPVDTFRESNRHRRPSQPGHRLRRS